MHEVGPANEKSYACRGQLQRREAIGSLTRRLPEGKRKSDRRSEEHERSRASAKERRIGGVSHGLAECPDDQCHGRLGKSDGARSTWVWVRSADSVLLTCSSGHPGLQVRSDPAFRSWLHADMPGKAWPGPRFNADGGLAGRLLGEKVNGEVHGKRRIVRGRSHNERSLAPRRGGGGRC